MLGLLASVAVAAHHHPNIRILSLQASHVVFLPLLRAYLTSRCSRSNSVGYPTFLSSCPFARSLVPSVPSVPSLSSSFRTRTPFPVHFDTPSCRLLERLISYTSQSIQVSAPSFLSDWQGTSFSTQSKGFLRANQNIIYAQFERTHSNRTSASSCSPITCSGQVDLHHDYHYHRPVPEFRFFPKWSTAYRLGSP